MRRGRTLFAVLGALVCAGLLALPAGAEDPESEELENAFTVLAAQGTHGYSVLVVAELDSDDPPTRGSRSRGSVIIYVIRKEQAALYIAPPATMTADFIEGIPTVTSMHVDLGRLGEVTLSFRPSGGKSIARAAHCPGGSLALAAGSYEGTFEFHGEENFTDASATSVQQRPEAVLNLFCQAERSNEVTGPRFPGAKLEVLARHAGEVGLQVNKNQAGARVHIVAGVEEDGPRLIVVRTVTINAPSGVFSFDPALRHARLSPGGPFAGRAIFDRRARPRNRWRGNLTVDLPGRVNAPLAHPGREVTLEHALRRVTGHGPATDRGTLLGRALGRVGRP